MRVESQGDRTGDYELYVRQRTVFTNAYGMEFELLPPGQFNIGSRGRDADPDEQPVTPVRIGRPFYMGKHEITQGQWKAVMGTEANPSKSRICDECPVESVTWENVIEFVRRLNESLDTTMLYRLPTEAEWEYAARAGQEGDRYAPLDLIAWHEGNSCEGNSCEENSGQTYPVGQKRANGFGLHDMLGNVWEWVQDWYGPYPEMSTADPVGPARGTERVRRGCSWYSKAQSCRLANRYSSSPDYRASNLGFRLVLQPLPDRMSTDDHGDIFSAATTLTIGEAVDGTIGLFDTDFFRLDLSKETAKTDLVIYTTGASIGSMWGRLWGEKAGSQNPEIPEILASKLGSSGADNFVINASLDPGIYFVEVTSVVQAVDTYALHVQQQVPTDISVCLASCGSNDIRIEFVEVPAGRFLMGSSSAESHWRERPVTPVVISSGFYMGRYEVTQAQWEAVMGAEKNPSLRKDCDECPVDSVTWNAVQEFIKRLNQIDDKRTYRLPTGAEWEYAARAQTTGERYSDDLAQIAWYAENSLYQTHPVGERLTNKFGLHDMLGNVSEWVEDWSGGIYPGGEVALTNPTGPRAGMLKMFRGCDWSDSFGDCRSGGHGAASPDNYASGGLGFRLVVGSSSRRHILDDHPSMPNYAHNLVRASGHLLPSHGSFELLGDLAEGDDKDYIKIRVTENTSATLAAAFTNAQVGRANVELGTWFISTVPTFGTGQQWQEDCRSMESTYSDGSDIEFDLDPQLWYCVKISSKDYTAGTYKLVINTAEREYGEAELVLEAMLGTREGKIKVSRSDGSESFPESEPIEFFQPLKREFSRQEGFDDSFRLPTVIEKTRVAIYFSSDVDATVWVQEADAIQDKYISMKETFPVVFDLEPSRVRRIRIESGQGDGQDGGGSYMLLVDVVRLVREHDAWTNELGMEFVKLPHSNDLSETTGASRFFLGSEAHRPVKFFRNDDEIQFPTPQCKNISPLWIGKYEVTRCEWVQLRELPKGHQREEFDIITSEITHADHGDEGELHKAKVEFYCGTPEGDKPVVSVTYRDVEAYIKDLNSTDRLPEGLNDRLLLPEGTKEYKLPTEAEWEYAAQAGTWGETYAGGREHTEIAWHEQNSEGEVRMVGMLLPNQFGLHDTLGNVWEWVNDDHNREANPVAQGASSAVESEAVGAGVGVAATALAAAGTCAAVGTFIFPVLGTGAGAVSCGGVAAAATTAFNVLVKLKKQVESKVIRGGSFLEPAEFTTTSIRLPANPGKTETTIRHPKDLIQEWFLGDVKTDVGAKIKEVALDISDEYVESLVSSIRKGQNGKHIGTLLRLSLWAKGGHIAILKSGVTGLLPSIPSLKDLKPKTLLKPLAIFTSVEWIVDKIQPARRPATVREDIGFRLAIQVDHGRIHFERGCNYVF